MWTPYFRNLYQLGGPEGLTESNVVQTWTKHRQDSTKVSLQHLNYHEHFECLSLVLPYLGPQCFFRDPQLFHFLLVRGSIGTPKLFDLALPLRRFNCPNFTLLRLACNLRFVLFVCFVLCVYFLFCFCSFCFLLFLFCLNINAILLIAILLTKLIMFMHIVLFVCYIDTSIL